MFYREEDNMLYSEDVLRREEENMSCIAEMFCIDKQTTCCIAKMFCVEKKRTWRTENVVYAQRHYTKGSRYRSRKPCAFNLAPTPSISTQTPNSKPQTLTAKTGG